MARRAGMWVAKTLTTSISAMARASAKGSAGCKPKSRLEIHYDPFS